MQHEMLAVFARQRVDDLRGDFRRLRLPREPGVCLTLRTRFRVRSLHAPRRKFLFDVIAVVAPCRGGRQQPPRDLVADLNRTALYRVVTISERTGRLFIGDRHRLVEQRIHLPGVVGVDHVCSRQKDGDPVQIPDPPAVTGLSRSTLNRRFGQAMDLRR